MNILPKKRWHVRTRENIARVRKDEAAAAEEDKKRVQKIELAEKEARTELLRAKAREQYGYVPKKEEPKLEIPLIGERGHVNLFYELEDNAVVSNKTNAEHEKEAKDEKEKEEMKIGYLTYLGQDTNELTGNVSWYNKLPARPNADEQEIGLKEKLRADPLKGIRSYLQTDGIKDLVKTCSSKEELRHKTPKKMKKKKKKEEKIKKLARKIIKKRKSKKRKRSRSSSDSSSEPSKKKKKEKRSSSLSYEKERCQSISNDSSRKVDVEKLRAERLRRELVERQRAAALLARMRGDVETPKETPPVTEVVQKYNSQFNPILARQNYPQD